MLKMTDAKRRELLMMAVVALVIAVATAAMCATWSWWHTEPGRWGSHGYTLGAALVTACALLRLFHRHLEWSLWQYAVVVAAGLAIGFPVGRALAPDMDAGPASSAEYRYMIHLQGVATEHIPLRDIRRGMMGTTIAVVEAARVRSGAARVRNALIAGLDDRFLHHVITVGGPHADLIDKACRGAARRLPKVLRGNITIVLVTPESISDNARQVLKDKGLEVVEVEHEFPDQL